VYFSPPPKLTIAYLPLLRLLQHFFLHSTKRAISYHFLLIQLARCVLFPHHQSHSSPTNFPALESISITAHREAGGGAEPWRAHKQPQRPRNGFECNRLYCSSCSCRFCPICYRGTCVRSQCVAEEHVCMHLMCSMHVCDLIFSIIFGSYCPLQQFVSVQVCAP